MALPPTQAGDGARGSAQNVSSLDESILGADALAGPASSDLRAEDALAPAGDDGSGDVLLVVVRVAGGDFLCPI